MTRRERPVFCPRCGSHETQAIRTGWPEPELGQTSPRQGGVPFGRLLGIDNPDRVCRKCGQQWLTRAGR